MDDLDAIVLAGGKSSRFGSDKASALLRGRPLLQWVVSALGDVCQRIVVVRATGQVLPEITTAVEITVVEDLYEGRGPLAGLVAGFTGVTSELCFATACDVPLLQPGLVRHLASLADAHDVVCPVVDGFHQPLSSIYRKATCGPLFRELVEREELRIVPAYQQLDALIVEEAAIRDADPRLLSFRNANRPERLVEIEALLG